MRTQLNHQQLPSLKHLEGGEQKQRRRSERGTDGGEVQQAHFDHQRAVERAHRRIQGDPVAVADHFPAKG